MWILNNHGTEGTCVLHISELVQCVWNHGSWSISIYISVGQLFLSHCGRLRWKVSVDLPSFIFTHTNNSFCIIYLIRSLPFLDNKEWNTFTFKDNSLPAHSSTVNLFAPLLQVKMLLLVCRFWCRRISGCRLQLLCWAGALFSHGWQIVWWHDCSNWPYCYCGTRRPLPLQPCMNWKPRPKSYLELALFG